jgi:hypothetical protein
MLARRTVEHLRIAGSKARFGHRGARIVVAGAGSGIEVLA